MEIKCGTDIIEIDRIRESIEKMGERFVKRVFTKNEILNEKISKTSYELNQIKTSKRWNYMNKIFNAINKIRRLGRGE